MATQLQNSDDQDGDHEVIDPGEGEDQQIDDAGEGEEDDDLDIGFEGESANDADDDTPLVKKLRNEIRERDRKLAEAAKPAAKIEVGPKPDLWDDAEGDQDKYDALYDKWKSDKAEAAKQEAEASKTSAAQNEEHTAALDQYRARKIAMARPDFDDAEAAVIDSLDNVRQALIVHAAGDPAKVIYALGRSPGKLAELAGITNPIKFVAAIAKLEEKITMTPRRKAPNPDTPVRGSAPIGQKDVDAEEARLEKEADRTNDRSKLVAYRRQKKLQSAK